MDRAKLCQTLGQAPFDVLVIGGGINGAASAAALAGQGRRVALVERGDFAGETSMASSNMVWGGIKYMESGEFGLVARLCRSRNELLRTHPANVRETRFYCSLRPEWRRNRAVFYAGAWLYWLLGRGKTCPPRWLGNGTIACEEPLIETGGLGGGVEYSDGWLPETDARFTFQFIRQAWRQGAAAVNYMALESATWDGARWRAAVRDQVSGARHEVRARVLLNAAGPQADALNARHGIATEHRLAFSKGVHLIVPRLSDSGRILAFIADDNRLFFVLPLGRRTCIGTTDTPQARPECAVTDEDRRFILDNINERLRLAHPLTTADIIAERCGVRPLACRRGSSERDWMKLSRKHVMEVDATRRHVTILGGKLTDCLNVGQEAVEMCARLLEGETERTQQRGRNASAVWHAEPDATDKAAFEEAARALVATGKLAATQTERLWRRYGSEARDIVRRVCDDARMGEEIMTGSGLMRAEVHYMAQHEMVVRFEDFLRRRTMLALEERAEDLEHAAGIREARMVLCGIKE
jgi:glycerol-3-phosphate dehydrogenase